MHTIETDELRRVLEQGEDVVLVNVLDAESFAQGHIPGSHHVPYTDKALVTRVERLAERKDRRIVVYCANRECPASHEAGEKLEAAGFTDVVHYPGGIDEWAEAGLDMERGQRDGQTRAA